MDTLYSQLHTILSSKEYFRKIPINYKHKIRSFVLNLIFGDRPLILSEKNAEGTLYWYAYYPICGRTRFIAFDEDIKQAISGW